MTGMQALRKFLQENRFKVIIVEGPRGVGKTTLCSRLCAIMDLVYYKTWGPEQKLLRHRMGEVLNLDLPQGTYFVLDFVAQVVAQVPLIKPVIADRGNISALVYQHGSVHARNSELRRYYVKLMRESRSVLLNLTCPEDVLLRRRVERKSDDEFKLHIMRESQARGMIQIDLAAYKVAIAKMLAVGLVEVGSFELDEGCTCEVYAAEGMEIKLLPEELHERDS